MCCSNRSIVINCSVSKLTVALALHFRHFLPLFVRSSRALHWHQLKHGHRCLYFESITACVIDVKITYLVVNGQCTCYCSVFVRTRHWRAKMKKDPLGVIVDQTQWAPLEWHADKSYPVDYYYAKRRVFAWLICTIIIVLLKQSTGGTCSAHFYWQLHFEACCKTIERLLTERLQIVTTFQ